MPTKHPRSSRMAARRTNFTSKSDIASEGGVMRDEVSTISSTDDAPTHSAPSRAGGARGRRGRAAQVAPPKRRSISRTKTGACTARRAWEWRRPSRRWQRRCAATRRLAIGTSEVRTTMRTPHVVYVCVRCCFRESHLKGDRRGTPTAPCIPIRHRRAALRAQIDHMLTTFGLWVFVGTVPALDLMSPCHDDYTVD